MTSKDLEKFLDRASKDDFEEYVIYENLEEDGDIESLKDALGAKTLGVVLSDDTDFYTMEEAEDAINTIIDMSLNADSVDNVVGATVYSTELGRFVVLSEEGGLYIALFKKD